MGKKLDTNEVRRMVVPFEVKEVKASESGLFAGTFEGYAAGILNIDRAGDMILPGAFADDLPRFLSEGVVCWQHDWADPIGVPLKAKEDAYGLLTESRISNTTRGRDCMTLIRDGVVKKLSIGYRVSDYQWVDRSGLQSYLGGSGLPTSKCSDILRQYDEADLDELLLLKKIKLFEYSPVSIPANPNAVITGAKALLAGLSFRDQLLTALAAVREVKERAQEIKTLRVSEGRNLSEERQEKLHALAAECLSVSEEVRAILAEQMKPEEKAEDVQSDEPPINTALLFAEFQRIEARRLCAA